MTRFLIAAAAFLATACQPAAAPPAMAPATPAPAAFAFAETTPLLEFRYSWPAEVSAIPALAARFSADMESWKASLTNTATTDRAYRDTQGFPFNAYQGSKIWTTAGQSERLLSLSGAIDDYTGGAHGNHGTHGLIWDRVAGTEHAFADLFATPASPSALLTQPWCKALDAERAVKREGRKIGGEFDECPKLSEISIVPTDADANGRFETLRLIADPYVAGPYAEGNYKVDLPVTPALIAALKPDHRASFELQRQ
jgi:hypothetical protein